MLTTAEIQALASRPERPQNCVLTVYLNIDQSRQANLNRVFETQLKDMLTSVENSIRDEDELAAFAKASKRIQDFVVDTR
jgi:hypothetical protein